LIVRFPVLELLGLALPALRRCPAEDALHARDELARVERLRHVVVRTDLEPDDLVDVLVACGEHEDRDVEVLRMRRQSSTPSPSGQVEIENHECRESLAS
jgi:hypothetical protein